MIKTFEEKKEHAELMRNIFGITAVLYIGFIIWIACIHRYEILWWAFNVWLLLVCIAVKNQNEKKDAELAISAIEHEHNRCNIIKDIYKNHTWISVKDRLPDEDLFNRGYSEEVVGLFMDGNIRISHCYCSIDEGIWFFKGLTCDPPTHWTPIKKTP